MPKITLKKTESGTVEILRDGERVRTASADTAESLARGMGGEFIGFEDQPAGDVVTEDIPGLGTLERIKKDSLGPTAPEVTPTADTDVPVEDIPATDEDEEVIEIPTFGTPEVTDQRGTLSKQFDDINTQIDKISKDILASKTPSEEEKTLLKDLQTKREQLRSFDLSTLKTFEDISGQRISTGFIAGQQNKERRTRALERLGLAQEAQSLVEQLGLSQAERQALGDVANAQLDLAGKKLDLALGLQAELDKLDKKEKDEARAFILDVIDLADGKTFEELDLNTQVRLTEAIANSPLTADMVKTALENSAKGADRILTVAEAKSLGMPFGTKISEAFGITPKATDAVDPENPGGYSTQESRRLRDANIDPFNIAEADSFLYGDGARREPDLTDIDIDRFIAGAQEAVGLKEDGELIGFEDLESAIAYFEGESPVIEIEDAKGKAQLVKLTPEQAQKVADGLRAGRKPGVFENIKTGASALFNLVTGGKDEE